jgi:valyl-tRNA synthetase
VVEPLISQQWFVKVAPLAQEALKAVEQGHTRIIPEHWTKTYFDWLNNIRDWCVSRQIWWGHRIPAWTCEDCGEVIVAREDPTECPKCNGSRLSQETDVLDTWFSSALWPFSTMGWPERTELLQTFYPTSCLVTGFDILFFWVARMMMMGLKFMNDVPFKDVYIHALVRDELGKKMSKSLGNVIDPLEVMDRFGTDAFRFTLAALAAQGRDIRMSESRIEGYRNFMNKIWNAARFALPYLDGDAGTASLDSVSNLSLPDRWILSRLNRTVEEVHQAIETYRFNDAAQALYHFTWHEFCDWYIEEAKISLSGDDPEAKKRAATVLKHVLDAILRLLHPFIPFITEEIAAKIPTNGSSIMRGHYPAFDASRVDDEAEKIMNLLMGLVTAVRSIRAEMNLPPSKALPVHVLPASAEDSEIVEANSDMITTLARVSELIVMPLGNSTEPPRMSAVAVVGEMRIFVPLEGIVNPDAEIARLEKELAKVDKDFQAVEKKLANRDFVAKASPEAIEKQRNRQAELSAKRSGLGEALKKMQDLKNS